VRRPQPSPALLLLLASCNAADPSDAPRCGGFEACGGDIVGTWGIEASCAGPSAVEDCAQSLVRYSNYNRTGTYRFGESGEYTLTQRTRFTRHVTVPHSCLAGTSCATYESLLESETGEADANCRDGGSSCSCDVTTSLEEMLTGSYDVDDATLTLSNGDEYEFCVDGTSLSLESGALEVFLTKF
jgi:hypothetical protein